MIPTRKRTGLAIWWFLVGINNFLAGWRHALRSEWPFIIIIIINNFLTCFFVFVFIPGYIGLFLPVFLLASFYQSFYWPLTTSLSIGI